MRAGYLHIWMGEKVRQAHRDTNLVVELVTLSLETPAHDIIRSGRGGEAVSKGCPPRDEHLVLASAGGGGGICPCLIVHQGRADLRFCARSRYTLSNSSIFPS